MSKMSRDKGKVGEREFAELLRAHGFADARRGVQYRGGPGSPDVVGVPGYHFEVKRVETFSPYTAYEQALTESGAHETSVVAHRKNQGKWMIFMSANDFLKLIKEHQETAWAR